MSKDVSKVVATRLECQSANVIKGKWCLQFSGFYTEHRNIGGESSLVGKGEYLDFRYLWDMQEI